jgi:hypothetical protein
MVDDVKVTKEQLSEDAKQRIISDVFKLSYTDMQEVSGLFKSRLSKLEEGQPRGPKTEKKGFFGL